MTKVNKGLWIFICCIAMFLSVMAYAYLDKKSFINKQVKYDEAEINRIVDGDTIVVDIDDEEVKVRLIGVDAPESVHPQASKNTEYGQMADDYLKAKLSKGDKVYLTYDKNLTDNYGRTLAFVWYLEDKDFSVKDIEDSDYIDKYMVNAWILEDGYGIAKYYSPNNKYSSYFDQLEAKAFSSRKGLWQFDEYSIEYMP